ncbi:MAG: aminomethyl-transferring glycine dehydrogenase subunit GcvPB [Nitrospinota bacterium]
MLNEPLIFERSSPGRQGCSLPPLEVPERPLEELLPRELIREEVAGFPEVSEVDVVRHFTRLSQWNYCVDLGLYPLGSCTMKYSPKVNEEAARLPGFSRVHPLQPEESCQGALRLMHELDLYLREITGMDRVILQPAAGAQGELTGIMLIRAYHLAQGRARSKVLIPDSAHGTNPASTSLCGYRAVEVRSNERGCVSLGALAEVLDDEVAALMLTNPNTLGLFEEEIQEMARLVHERGGLVYCDGANMNALMGISRMGDMGVDVVQLNLHKTFSTPHGGGGPGAGPVGIKKLLEPFIPVPSVEREGDRYFLSYDIPQSIGRVGSFMGNFGVLVRAYAYIRSLGAEGLKRASELAVLNANYLRAMLEDYYQLPYDRHCMHECVFSDRRQSAFGVSTHDIAKRMMDYGYHPPTVYFPLIVRGALMIEPTESESKESLDQFIAALRKIAQEAEEEPALLKNAPHLTKLTRLDETRAAKNPILRWTPGR